MSSEAQHAPGEWKVEDVTLFNTRYWYVPDVTEVNCGPYAEANARLIAAAPDLLEAAKSAYSAMSAEDPVVRDEGLYDELGAAIDKAEGRA